MMNDYLTRREIFLAFSKSLDDITRDPIHDEETTQAEVDAIHHFYRMMIQRLDAKTTDTEAPSV